MAHTSGHGHGGTKADLSEIAKLGYEPRDIALNTLSVWLGVLFVFIVMATVFGYFLFKAFAPKYAEMERAAPMAYVHSLPPNPQVQVRPKRDMIDYWAHEDAIIQGYTPGDKGAVNLPLGKAIDMMAEKGISGVTGEATPPKTDAYPGSGVYTSKTETVAVEGTESLNGNFEGSVAPNPYIGHPVPMPQPSSAAPAATDTVGGAAAPAPGAE